MSLAEIQDAIDSILEKYPQLEKISSAEKQRLKELFEMLEEQKRTK